MIKFIKEGDESITYYLRKKASKRGRWRHIYARHYTTLPCIESTATQSQKGKSTTTPGTTYLELLLEKEMRQLRERERERGREEIKRHGVKKKKKGQNKNGSNMRGKRHLLLYHI